MQKKIDNIVMKMEDSFVFSETNPRWCRHEKVRRE